jgi:predicted  nucleic acid-binding Zn-ribbon protein
VNKHLNELVELSKIDKAIDSYTPQLQAADKKVNKAQQKTDNAQADLDKLNADIADNETKVKK